MRYFLAVLFVAVLASPVAAQRPAARVPDSVKVERDIVYARYGDRDVQLDLYLPKKSGDKKIPCIVVIHGGGWRSGNKERFARFAIHMAENGFAAACIGYRLLPEVQIPSCVHDCKAAVRWVRANSAKYSIDADRIGAIGGSAGGHLVAMLATSHKVKELEGEGGNAGISSRVQAVVGLAAPSDMSHYTRRTGLKEEDTKLVSPITHVDKDSAPILLIHSDNDGTVPLKHSQELQAKYQAAGVPAELVTLEKAGHAFWNGNQHYPDTMDRSVKFFKKQLK